MQEYKVGDVVKGLVTGIEKYGIFVSVDNDYSGLIHISEISTSFVRNIKDYAQENECIKVKIIDIDKKNKHLKLSIKDLDNYRITKKNNSKIRETTTGFKTLSTMLEKWILAKKDN